MFFGAPGPIEQKTSYSACPASPAHSENPAEPELVQGVRMPAARGRHYERRRATAVIIAVIIMLFASGPIMRFIHAHPTVKMLALAFSR